jgi:mannose/cellobiose epimerase-like protein (N-acyl-D-glucosamine 2-epimerase family)
MMILSGISLYEITEEQSYLDQAIATARSSYSKFTKVVNDQLFFPSHDSWFNVELMKSFVELSEYDDTSKTYVETFIRNADYAWKNARNNEGQFYEDWSGGNQGRYYWLLHQACMIEAYGLAELYSK